MCSKVNYFVQDLQFTLYILNLIIDLLLNLVIILHNKTHILAQTH